jgi:hypothetical protein
MQFSEYDFLSECIYKRNTDFTEKSYRGCTFRKRKVKKIMALMNKTFVGIFSPVAERKTG